MAESTAKSTAKSTRRSFIKQASTGAGVLAATVAAATSLELASSTSVEAAEWDANSAGGSLVIYNINQKKGTFNILFGESEIIVHNPSLVRSLSSI